MNLIVNRIQLQQLMQFPTLVRIADSCRVADAAHREFWVEIPDFLDQQVSIALFSIHSGLSAGFHLGNRWCIIAVELRLTYECFTGTDFG
jgi:hypothetical protein